METLKDRLIAIRQRCDRAAEAAGRRPEEIDLLAVSKGNDARVLREAIDIGHNRFGENYFSEAMPKVAALRDAEVVWSFIGRIDSNKTRQIAENFDWVLSVSSAKIGRALDAHRPRVAPPLSVCIQVNIDDDENKAGVAPDQLDALVEALTGLRHLRLRGLMAIPRKPGDGHQDADAFHRLGALFNRYVADGHPWDTLSMGMSGDFEQAIAAGATQVRVGRALFGERRRKERIHE